MAPNCTKVRTEYFMETGGEILTGACDDLLLPLLTPNKLKRRQLAAHTAAGYMLNETDVDHPTPQVFHDEIAAGAEEWDERLR